MEKMRIFYTYVNGKITHLKHHTSKCLVAVNTVLHFCAARNTRKQC